MTIMIFVFKIQTYESNNKTNNNKNDSNNSNNSNNNCTQKIISNNNIK